MLDCQIRLEKAAVADVAFAIALEFYNILSAVLTKADDGAAFSPALCLRLLDEYRLTWIENWQFASLRVWILVLADLAETTFDLGAEYRLVVVDWSRQTISNFTAEEKLGRRVA